MLALRAFPGRERAADKPADPTGSIPAVWPGLVKSDSDSSNVARAENLGKNLLLEKAKDIILLVKVFRENPLAAFPLD